MRVLVVNGSVGWTQVLDVQSMEALARGRCLAIKGGGSWGPWCVVPPHNVPPTAHPHDHIVVTLSAQDMNKLLSAETLVIEAAHLFLRFPEAKPAVPRFQDWELWAKVKNNHAMMAGCAGHEFEKIPRVPGGSAITRYRCARCAGEVDHHAWVWYAKGLEHGAARAR